MGRVVCMEAYGLIAAALWTGGVPGDVCSSVILAAAAANLR